MRPNVGRRDMAPRILRGRDDQRSDRDGDGHVDGVRRHAGENQRDGMFPRIATFEACRLVTRVSM
jgi:hypothetical protein